MAIAVRDLIDGAAESLESTKLGDADSWANDVLGFVVFLTAEAAKYSPGCGQGCLPSFGRENRQTQKVMTNATTRNIDTLAPAMKELETCAAVKLRAIESERHYRAMVEFMNELLDEIGDRENHPLIGLLDIVTAFVSDYEESHVEIPESDPVTALRFLMQQHKLRQADLAGIFGSQSSMREVLNGKHEINARQARELGKRFRVSPAVFI